MPSASRRATSCVPCRCPHASDNALVRVAGMNEVNFDGIPGPTHNYAGLAHGNLAAERNAQLVANPREAALQGLHKMRTLASMGYAQAVLPPHERPYVSALRALGFDGN